MRYLITGGAGFIGSNLADKLLAGKKTEGNYVKLKREDVIRIYESAAQ